MFEVQRKVLNLIQEPLKTSSILKIAFDRGPAEADCKQCGVVFGSAHFCSVCRLLPSKYMHSCAMRDL